MRKRIGRNVRTRGKKADKTKEQPGMKKVTRSTSANNEVQVVSVGFSSGSNTHGHEKYENTKISEIATA